MKYRQQTKKKIDQTFKSLTNFLEDIAKQFSSIGDLTHKLEMLEQDPEYSKLSSSVATSVVNMQRRDDARGWREAAKHSTRGKLIYQYLKKEFGTNQPFQELIDQSADLIRTLPHHISTKVVKKVQEMTLKGERQDVIAKTIRTMFPSYTRASARLIARTQVSKTLTAITTIRAQNVGVKFYIWRTVGGPLVRDSHRHMNGVVIPFDQDPSPEALIGKENKGYYKPGGIYNCRCYMETVLDTDQIKFPAKVYWRGRIERMSKRRFNELTN